MSDYSQGSSNEKSWLDYFPVQIPLAIFLATFLTITIIQVIEVTNQHSQLSHAQLQLSRDDVQKQLRDAQLVGRKLDALIHELADLSATDPAAKRILDEFHIQVPAAQAAH